MSHLVAQLDLAKWAEPQAKDAACRTLYDQLWDAREELVKDGSLYLFVYHGLLLEKERHVPAADAKIIALLRLELQRLDYFYDSIGLSWCPELFPAEEAQGLWQDLQGYEKRYLAKHPDAGGYFPSMHRKFVDRFGEPGASGDAPPPLTIRQFWLAQDAPRRFILGTDAVCPAPDGAWVAGLIDGESASGKPLEGALYHVVINPALAEPFSASPRIKAPLPEIRKTLVTPGRGLSLVRHARQATEKR